MKHKPGYDTPARASSLMIGCDTPMDQGGQISWLDMTHKRRNLGLNFNLSRTTQRECFWGFNCLIKVEMKTRKSIS